MNSLDVPEPNPLDTFRIHAALHRSTESSLGSIVLSALLLTIIRVVAGLTAFMRRAPLSILPLLAMPINFLGNLTGALSNLALIYVGITGDAFFPSARRAQALTVAVANSSGRVKYRRSGIDRKFRKMENLNPTKFILSHTVHTDDNTLNTNTPFCIEHVSLHCTYPWRSRVRSTSSPTCWRRHRTGREILRQPR